MGYQGADDTEEDLEYVENTERDTECLLVSGEREENSGEGRKIGLGVILALASNVLFTTNNFLMRRFQVNVCDAVLVKCVLQIVFLTAYLYKKGEPILPESIGPRVLTLLQGISGAICLIMCLASVRTIPVVEALAIIYLCPVVTMCLACLMLGDQLNLAKIFSGLVLILGELLVCQPPFLFPSENSPSPDDMYYYLLGVGMALLACVSASFNAIYVSMLKTKPVPVAVLLDWVAIFVVILAVGFSLIVGDSQILSSSITSMIFSEWLILFCLAISCFLGYLCITISLQLICPFLYSSIRSLELVLATVVTSFLTHQLPSVLTSFGVILLTSGVMVLTFQEKICKTLRITNEEVRRYFRWCISCNIQQYEAIP